MDGSRVGLKDIFRLLVLGSPEWGLGIFVRRESEFGRRLRWWPTKRGVGHLALPAFNGWNEVIRWLQFVQELANHTSGGHFDGQRLTIQKVGESITASENDFAVMVATEMGRMAQLNASIWVDVIDFPALHLT